MKDRRVFLKAITAICAGCLASPSMSGRLRYGAITLEKHRRLCEEGTYLRVMHRDRDVTKDCFFADDTGEGLADLFLNNADGRPGRVARNRIYGVTLVRKPDHEVA